MYSLVLAMAYVLVLVIAAVPELHLSFHQDANQAEHKCAATLLASGLVDLAPAAALPAATVAGEIEPTTGYSVFFLSISYNLLFERGPPSLTASFPLLS